MQSTDHSLKTEKDSTTRTVVLTIIVFLLLIACFMFWYFYNFQPATDQEAEEIPEEIDTPLTEGGQVIVENVRKTEELCMDSLKKFGFNTNQAMDGWYDFDEDGTPVYYAKTKFGNFSIRTKDPDSGKYDIYPQERYLIGSVNVRDPNTPQVNKFVNQSNLNCAMFYVAEQDDTNCIYVDVWNDTVYKTTYLMEEHLYNTEVLSGAEAQKYARR